MKVSIIGGCGHADAVCEAAERGVAFELGGVCPSFPGDASPRYLAERFAACGKRLRVYPGVDAMLDAERPEIVVVDGVFGAHADHACDMLRRGMHVLCDKPAATTPGQLTRIERAARESDQLYWSILTSRYDPWFATAKRLVDEGAIGEARLLDGQKSYKLGERPDFYRDPVLYGGTIAWVGIHMLDLMLWITGKRCQRVSAFGSTACNGGLGALEAATLSNLELEDGVLASVRADYLRPGFAATHGDDRLRVVGTRGSVEVREETVYLLNDAHPTLTPIPNDVPGTLFADFLRAASEGAPARINREDSLESTRVALALTRSLRENRTVDLPDR